MKDVTIVVGTVGQSIMRSEDNGNTWVRVGPKRGFAYEASVRCIAMNPKDPNILFAGTERGLYRSNDRGATWSRVSPASDFLNSFVGVADSWDGRFIAGVANEGFVVFE